MKSVVLAVYSSLNGGDDVDGSRRSHLLLCSGLVFVGTLAYSSVWQFEFTDVDDNLLVFHNPNVSTGLSWENFLWAFSTSGRGQWMPLTWLSHQLDVELFGLWAGGHHLTNVYFHLASTVLVFLVWRRMTGRELPSALLALVFAIHPLNVESVAWVSERRNVVSLFFGLITIWCYLNYAERGEKWRYLAVVGCLALGLMGKPMIVTLPLLLLLLDLWPLGRVREFLLAQPPLPWRKHSAKKIVVEKVPLLLICFVSGVLTVICQANGRSIGSVDDYPLGMRLLNAVASYALYIRRTLIPTDLAVFYPHSAKVLDNPWQVLVPASIAGAIVLGVISVVVIYNLRSRPYLFVGWCWYLIGLLPMSGLIQVGGHALADRYAYFPMLGLLWMGIWGLADAANYLRIPPTIRWTASIAGTAMLGMMMWQQLSTWRNSQALGTHALTVTHNNYLVHNLLGVHYVREENLDVSAAHFQECLRILPDYGQAMNNLAVIRLRQGNYEDAARLAFDVIDLEPQEETFNTMVKILSQSLAEGTNMGRNDLVDLTEKAVENTEGNDSTLLLGLTMAYGKENRWQEAIFTAQLAHDVATRKGDHALANAAQSLIRDYRTQLSFVAGMPKDDEG